MMRYECHVCHGSCDPGELENGVCFDCRKAAIEEQERKSLEMLRMWNRKDRYKKIGADS